MNAPALPIEELWTVTQVAAYLKAGRSWVYAHCQPLGDLPCLRLGPQLIRFDPEAVKAWALSKAHSRPAQVLPLKGPRP